MRRLWFLIRRLWPVLAVATLLAIACRPADPPLFRQLSPGHTGITFANRIDENLQHNVYTYRNLYNGGGVGVGDVNNDGLMDLYFTGGLVAGRLYLNKGNLQFEDVTEAAGLGADRWETGVAMVDVNQDGWTDIYVCVSGVGASHKRANLLYVNNGDGTYTERAQAFGIADTRQTTQASFLDYDRDGDLDLFLIINPTDYELFAVNTVRLKQLDSEAASTDVLYRNNGDGTFSDVSAAAGIQAEGYSLGLSVSDINDDGWPDVYVANDFLTNDLLYVNQGDGTFSDEAPRRLKHQSFAGMGSDVADVNNDGLVDIFVLDMLPASSRRRKLTLPAPSYAHFQRALAHGYQPQYTRNTLQLNRGNGTFSEIGQLAGVAATDWSWAALFADFDLDGHKDLFVTNGFRRDMGNLDYLVRQNALNTPFGDQKAKRERKIGLIHALDGLKLRDYLFRNRGDLTFEDVSAAWGITEPSFSNGAAYADLDNDGDLDLVVNALDEVARVYENRARDLLARNYLQVALRGPASNRQGIGSRVLLKQNDQVQVLEQFPTRGYESAVDPVLHFGLGRASAVDTVAVRWPDGTVQRVANVLANQRLVVDYDAAMADVNSDAPNQTPQP